MTGDQNDCLARLKALLPNAWFNAPDPVLDGVLNGLAYLLSFAYSLIAYTRLQTRIATATDGFLDLISFDFLGTTLPRNSGELDNPFRARILANILKERGTRKGMSLALQTLTGRTPSIFEPTRPADTGTYGGPYCGYGAAGGYGSLKLRNQCFVVAYRASSSGIPYVAGYGVPTGAYSTPSRADYASLSQIQGAVTDAGIFATVDATKMAGTICWTRLSS